MKPGSSLQATALVNEVYLRLTGTAAVSFRDRSQFFALAAQMMRGILVDAARARASAKRGGNVPMVAFEEEYFARRPGKAREIVALDDALRSLARFGPLEKRGVWNCGSFGGLSIEGDRRGAGHLRSDPSNGTGTSRRPGYRTP